MHIAVVPVVDDSYQRETVDNFRRLANSARASKYVLVDEARDADLILVAGLHQVPDDPTLRRLRRHPVVRRHRPRICVYDERDRPFYTFPGVYVSATPRIVKRFPVVGGAYPAAVGTSQLVDASPDLLFSFAGSRTHRVRREVLKLSHPRAVVRDMTGLNFFGSDDARVRGARAEFASLLGRSKFVLCPRGAGASSIRLFETLAMGRVPVVISDYWLAPPGLSWDQAVVRVPEADIGNIPLLLEDLEPQWEALARAARSLVASAFAEATFWNYLGRCLEQVDNRRPTARSPWWGTREFYSFPLIRSGLAARSSLGRIRRQIPIVRNWRA